MRKQSSVVHRRPRRWGSFPTTADVGISAGASTVSGLFEALGLGLFALITDLRRVRPREQRSVEVTAVDLPGLTVAYLNALIVLQQSQNFLARQIRIRSFGEPPIRLSVTLWGEPFDPTRHTQAKEVKAATWHNLRVDLSRRTARVIVDI